MWSHQLYVHAAESLQDVLTPDCVGGAIAKACKGSWGSEEPHATALTA